MTSAIKSSVLTLGLLTLCGAAFADDIEGKIESIDAGTQTITVAAKAYTATGATEYDDTLKSFSDLKVGQSVEVDYNTSRAGQMFITEIEIND